MLVDGPKGITKAVHMRPYCFQMCGYVEVQKTWLTGVQTKIYILYIHNVDTSQERNAALFYRIRD